jgi:uncharacterized iron-regulated membrane protein
MERSSTHMAIPNPRLTRQITLVHRHLGLAASVVIVVLAVTGVLLNHSEEFSFLERPIRSQLLLDWYGLSPEGELTSFPAGRHWAVGLERGIYVDAHYVAATETPLIGAIELDEFLVLATRDSLLLVTRDGAGTLIDRLQSASLPGDLQRVGLAPDGHLLVEEADGIHRADRDLLTWQAVDLSEQIRWSSAAKLPAEHRRAVLASFRGAGLPLSRVIADLHSGRIVGRFGPLLMDGSALVFTLVAATGFYNWWRSRRPSGAPAARPPRPPYEY